MRIESKGGFQLISFSVIIVLVVAIVLDIALHTTTSAQAAGLIIGLHVVGNNWQWLLLSSQSE
jgi:hypothetical protein